MGRKILRIGIITLLLLLIPFVAMQFTDEVVWDFSDFAIMGILLFVTGIIFELVRSNITNKVARTTAGVVIILLFLLVWAELAVGIFGTPWAGS
ncbi:hypothetical protein CL654_01390 [bacterium]|nr:hypothetical protein [bacterium]|tara:strand:- start:16831 stop:17112 length:282 start_codon:yes stop_codon:yes gene_type:complete